MFKEQSCTKINNLDNTKLKETIRTLKTDNIETNASNKCFIYITNFFILQI